MSSRILQNYDQGLRTKDQGPKARKPLSPWSIVHSPLSSIGFTLIEVLVAVALVSVIMLLIWQATSQTINAKQRIEKRNEVTHNARIAVDKMVQDISMAFLLNGTPHVGLRQGSPQLKTLFKGESSTLEFTSLNHLRLFGNSRESEMTEIGYKMEKDPDNRDLSLLMRRESKWIDNKSGEGGAWIALAQQVKNLKLEYYDARKYEWQSSWNTESDTGLQLPRAVRITIAFENPDNKNEDVEITTIAMLGMNNAIEF